MSSVGSADKRSQQDEALRRARETYQEGEVEQAKKHSQEMKRITEAHQNEIRQMSEAHTRQMEELKTRTRDAISSRDMKYQGEIQDLRQMHQNQVRRTAEENEINNRRLDVAHKSELERYSAAKDRQTEEKVTQLNEELNGQGKRFAQALDKNRELVTTSITDEKRRMNEAHQKELKAMTTDRERQVDQGRRSYNSMRKAKDQQIKDLEFSKRQDNERLSSMHMMSLKDQAATHDAGLDNAREEMRGAIEQNRKRFEAALEKHTENSASSSEGFRTSITDRIDNHINMREMENKQLKSELSRQQSVLNNQKNREVKNAREAMGENIDRLERARLDTLEQQNGLMAKVTKEVNKDKEDMLRRTNRHFQDKIVNEKTVAEEKFNNTKLGFEKQIAMKDLQSDMRETRMRDSNQREELYLKEFYNETSHAQRENFDNSLREIREKNKRDQDSIFQNFAKQSAEREVKFQTKLNEVNSRFENQIQQIKQDQAETLKNQTAIAAKEKKAVVDQKNLEMQRQASQYENRLAKLEETHKREVENINRRHEESLVSMTRAKPRGST